MNKLNKQQLKHLKALSHSLKPVVMLGQHGLSRAVLDEIINTLDTHELIKVQIGGEDRAERAQITQEIVDDTNCTLVKTIGKQAIFYRQSEQKLIKLPK